MLAAAFGVLLVAILALAAWSLTGSRPETASAEPGTYAQVSTPRTGEKDDLTTWGDSADPVKAIYLTAYNAGSANLEAYLKLLDRTELNAVVVDVKDVTGEVMYPSKVPLANEIGATRQVLDLKSLTKQLKERDVYAIARVAVFEDDILPRQRPDLAVTDSSTGAPWLNDAGQTWANQYNKEVWKYNVAVAKEAARAGFDEIQFDYIRFPSDGPMETIDYGKETYPKQQEALAAFLKYADSELHPMGVRVASDVFGLAATEDGAGVGQYIDTLAPYLDVVCPMAYPSHYPPGSYGYDDPNSEPYKVIEHTMTDFEKKTKDANPGIEIRPWLQDFTLGTPPYGPEEVRAQMDAVYDSGATGWLLWNADNDYTEMALKASSR
ncbi:MAG TPA: putative glycoside hydrolase [Rubrobacteraceae bacterium]|nr:putative glycoside hydrolase [Rubrobacteraceae bacterium]